MLIQCPSCRARTDLAGHHEGKRVRCSECGRVHVARPANAPGRVSGARRRRLLAASVAVLALSGVVFVVCQGSAHPGAKAARGAARPPSSAEGAGQSSIEPGFARWYKEEPNLPTQTSDAGAGGLEPDASWLEPPDQDDPSEPSDPDD